MVAEQTNPRIVAKLGTFTAFTSLFAVAVGAVGLAGWILHIQVLKTIFPGQVAVKANTTICLILLGLAFWLVRKVETVTLARRHAADAAAALVSIVGLLSLLEWLFGWQLGIDLLLFSETPKEAAGSIRPGLMSPITGLGFTLLGLTVILVDRAREYGGWPVQTLSIGAATAAIFSIFDFLLDPRATHTHIAPAVAFAIFLFSCGLLCARKEWGTGALLASAGPGGNMARRMLPAAILFPVAIAWFHWRGTQEGMFAQWTGVAITAVAATALVAGLTAWTAAALDREERERKKAEAALRASQDWLSCLIQSAMDAIITVDEQQRIVLFNDAAEKMFLCPEAEALGQPLERFIPQRFRAKHLAHMRSFAQTGVTNHDITKLRGLRALRANGEEFQMEASISLTEATGRTLFTVILRDVTARVQAEEQLRSSEENYRTLFQSMDEGFCTIEVLFDQDDKPVDYRFLEVNSAFETQTGIAQAPGRRMREIAPLHEEHWFQIYGKVALTGQPVSFENEAAQLQRWYEVHAFRVGEPREKKVGIVFNDITERRRREGELRESEERFRLFIEHAPAALAMFDREMRYLHVSRRWRADYGLGERDLRGVSHYEVFPEVPQRWKEIHRRGLAGEVLRAEADPFERADGTAQWIWWEVRPWHDRTGAIGGIVIFAEDITERKLAEDALRASEARFQTMVNGIPQLAWMAEPDGHIFWYNQRWYEYTGTTFEQMEGWAWQSVHDPVMLPKVLEKWKGAIATGQPFDMEFPLRGADGVYRAFLTRVVPMKDTEGRVTRWLGTNTDISERQQAEREIHRLNAELEQRVIARTAQLEAANQELEAFTYSVSHDLRAPLRHISGFSKILSEEYGPSLAPDAQRHLQRIEEGTRRMGLLVDDLLNLARVGRRELSLRVAALRPMADELITELAPECAGRQIEWKIGPLPSMECDPGLVKQVFQNLLANALKFTRPRSQAVIEVGQKDEPEGLVLFVRDNGVGFNMKYADKLFGVFQRLHRAEEFEGTGVGLATVQRIIQKHGGRIWAEAELEKGATFYFTLGVCQKDEFKTRAAIAGERA